MAFLPGLKSIWNALKVILLVIIIVIILIVAWEAILIAFEFGAGAYPWLGAFGSAVNVAGAWAASNGWWFALASLVAIAAVSPEAAASIVSAIGRVLADVVEIVAGAAGDLLSSVMPGWLVPAIVAFVAYRLLAKKQRDAN